jgi:hypothetical protein
METHMEEYGILPDMVIQWIDSRENLRLKPFKKKHGFCHRLLELFFQLNQPMFTGNTPRNTACGAVLLKSVHLFGGSYTMVVPFIRASLPVRNLKGREAIGKIW